MKRKGNLFKKNENRNFLLRAFFEARLLKSYSNLRNLRGLSTASRVSIKDYCCITGRYGAVFLEYRISRLKFRSLALQGLLPGVQKAS
mmetsp:Transcript_4209/g.7032  ORF Transcript_4209/g.7032 Transcript_4209/m.7032 type:complete len:88 (+) Transcript_4209:1957-2220(+)